MKERNTELTNYCRSLLRWAKENQGILPPVILMELLTLIDRLMECA
jgi:hypothetical protein